jgi:hypothetical protein
MKVIRYVEVKAHLALSQIYMIHIKKEDDITVLVVIKSNSNLVENQLGVKPRRCLINFAVHNNLESIVGNSRNLIR